MKTRNFILHQIKKDMKADAPMRTCRCGIEFVSEYDLQTHMEACWPKTVRVPWCKGDR